MKNVVIALIMMISMSFTNNAISETTHPANDTNETPQLTEMKEKRVVAHSYTINVGRGATFFGISKQLSKVSGVNWTWELVDRVKDSHQMKYGKEVLKPNHKFIVSL